MRIEQNIATVTRTLVITTVREIVAVVSLVDALCLHLWLRRNLQAMPAYAGYMSGPAAINGGGNSDTGPGNGGSKRGRFAFQPTLKPASCPDGSERG